MPSWVSDSSRGQPAKLGQPSGLWVPVGAAGGEEVLDDRAGAVRVVVGAVAQRDRHSVRAPRPPAVEAAAEELEGAEVDVVVEEAAHAAPSGWLP